MVIRISGEWDEYRLDKLRLQAPAYLSESLVLDMTGTVFLSDAAAATLANLHNERQRRRLPAAALVISSPFVRLMLGSKDLDEAFRLYWSLEAALQQRAPTAWA